MLCIVKLSKQGGSDQAGYEFHYTHACTTSIKGVILNSCTIQTTLEGGCGCILYNKHRVEKLLPAGSATQHSFKQCLATVQTKKMADKSAQELETDRRGIERKLPPTGELYKAVTEPVVVASAVEGMLTIMGRKRGGRIK